VTLGRSSVTDDGKTGAISAIQILAALLPDYLKAA
jgi:hypothetical protein